MRLRDQRKLAIGIELTIAVSALLYVALKFVFDKPGSVGVEESPPLSAPSQTFLDDQNIQYRKTSEGVYLYIGGRAQSEAEAAQRQKDIASSLSQLPPPPEILPVGKRGR